MLPSILSCCCRPAVPPAPVAIWNRPGLDSLKWRSGTFATFRRAMLDRISGEPALAGLTTREPDDHAVTLIELAAAMADLLAFYTERLGNEFYLRTARERDSVLRLARLIGYELHPGLAATALLAFTVEEGARVRIRRGLPVMSVPGQDELPATYETLAEMLADWRLNAAAALGPPRAVNALARGATGGLILSRPAALGARDPLILFGAGVIEEKSVAALNAAAAGERLVFEPAVQASHLTPATARLARIERRMRFFGAGNPATHQVYDADPALLPEDRWNTEPIDGSFEWFVQTFPLDARYEELKAGAHLLVDAGPTAVPRLRTALVSAVDEGPERHGPLADTVTLATLRQIVRGTPALAAMAGADLAVARGGAGHLLFFSPGGWNALNFAPGGNPALLLTSSTRLDLFVRDGGRRLRHASYDLGGHWSKDFADYGGALAGDPVPLLSGGRTDVFATGDDHALWTLRLGPAGAKWRSLGGEIGPRIAAAATAPGIVDVFARGRDRALWWRRRVAGTWLEWQSLGGALAAGPAAASDGAGRLEVVALSDSGILIHRRREGEEWSPWTDLGGTGTGAPALVLLPGGNAEIFVRTSGGELGRIGRGGGLWSGWQSLGGAIAGDPVALAAAGGLRVEARGADGTLVHRIFDGMKWSEWSAREDLGIGPIPDRRSARIWQIGAQDVRFADIDFPASVDGGRIALRFDGEPPAELGKGRMILIEAGGRTHAATVAAISAGASVVGAAPDHLVVDFKPPLPGPLSEARVSGNIAPASHGETQREEPLGHGDGGRAFQRMHLQHAPVTHLAQSSLHPTPALEVSVSGERWREVPSLFGRGAAERVYTARRSDGGQTMLTFGDGVSGARLPTGAANVVARYRTGLGAAGRVRAGQLTTPLERPVGLRTVSNPLPSDGGLDPENPDSTRAAAPGTVRTFGRAVALRDFENIALASGLAARAHATWVWRRLERIVHITVCGPDAAPLSSSALANLHVAFAEARDPNRELGLANAVRVPLALAARIVPDPAREPEAVLAAALAAVLTRYAFDRAELGRAVHASAAFAALQSAPGVQAVDLDLFQLRGHAELTPAERSLRAVTLAAVQPHIRLFAARPAPADPTLIDRFARAGFEGRPPPVLAGELPFLDRRDVSLALVRAL